MGVHHCGGRQSPALATTRRGFLGTATWSLLLPAAMGLACGTRADLVESVLGPNTADASTPTPHVPRPPRFPNLTDADKREWTMFRRRFVAAEGRVVDTGNNCISHTEGQGWGMLFAVTFGDRVTFDRMFQWTQKTLKRSGDQLHSWRYDPSRTYPVDDPNNATDGDLFIAWALWKAAFRWNEPAYADQARLIAQDILDLLVVDAGARTLLLPGVIGFQHADEICVNPSYYCFPAMRDLAEAVPNAKWTRVRDSGLALIDTGRFGRWMLPPDWLSVSLKDGALEPASGWPARFAFDAIRVPLYLHWSRLGSPAVQQAFVSYWAQTGPQTPAWVDLLNGENAPYASPPGMVAVAKLATAPENSDVDTTLPSIHTSPDYYSSALILLSRLAAYGVDT